MWRAAALLSTAWALGPAAGESIAQSTYPTKPIRMIVPYAAGGPSDVVARAIGQKLGDTLRQQVVIDNRPGSGGNIGSAMVAKAPADGYTLVSGTVATHAINASLYKNMPYDVVKDFAPVAPTVSSTIMLVAHPSLPVKSVKELIALAKAKPGQLNFASVGTGSPHHLAGELLNTMAGIKMVHIPYKGAAPAISDLLGAQVTLGFVGLPAALPHVKIGKLTALGVTDRARAAVAPDVPTIAEGGLPGYEVGNWQGLFAPAGTPRIIVYKLNAEVGKILQSAEMKERLGAQGYDTLSMTPEEFSAYVKAEIVKWAKVVKDSGATAD